MRRFLIYALILALSIAISGCTIDGQASKPSTAKQQNEALQHSESNNKDGSIIYENADYGFRFSLPESWKNYKIVVDKWEGLAIGDAKGETVADNGPMLSIRHPKWTSANLRQDIPIMIFTTAQWKALQQGKFHIGAAPIGSSELGHNKTYVFALPARYNYAFPTGYEEVENLLQSKPLQPIGK